MNINALFLHVCGLKVVYRSNSEQIGIVVVTLTYYYCLERIFNHFMDLKQKEFTISDFKRNHKKFIYKEMCETFGLSCYSKHKFILNLVYSHYFYIFFRRYNFAKVVLDGDKPVGIVVGKANSKPTKNSYRLQRGFYAFLLFFTRAGHWYFKYSKLFKNTNAGLLKNLDPNYNEMELLEIKKDYRNYGLGKKLIEAYEAQIKNQEDHTYYLLTDDYCDVKY